MRAGVVHIAIWLRERKLSAAISARAGEPDRRAAAVLGGEPYPARATPGFAAESERRRFRRLPGCRVARR